MTHNPRSGHVRVAMTHPFIDVLRNITALQIAVFELADESVGENEANRAMDLCVKELAASIKSLRKAIS